jgi:translation initiation factor IF-3
VTILRRRFDRSPPREPQIRVNERIRIPEVRVVDSTGENLGVMQTREAMGIAREKGLDLVEVNPKASPPVCKIMDFGRFKYDQKKKARDAKKKATVVEIKEIKFRPRTEDHDFNHKIKRIREFLEDSNKVKLTVRFRGREMAHQDIGRDLLYRVADTVKDLGQIAQEPVSEGRAMSMLIAPVRD